MSAKRKWDDIASSDDEEPAMGKQVLPVANLPSDFDGDPTDGLQYLFMVRRDARTLPHTTKVVNPYEIKDEPRESAEDALQASGYDVLPSEEWRETFLRRFKNFRQNCTQPTIHIDIPPRTTHKTIPDRKERDHWWAFLSGRPESEWNPPKKPKKQNNRNERYGDYNRGMRGFSAEAGVPEHPSASQAGPSYTNLYGNDAGEAELAVTTDPTESLPTPSGTPAPPDRGVEVRPIEDSVTPTSHPGSTLPEPTPSLMRQIDHRYAIHLLMYFAHWINLHLEEDVAQKYVVTESHARWMFVLLSRVDDFISADETSTLRSLARGCMGLIRKRMSEHAASETDNSANEYSKAPQNCATESSCWIIITAIVGIWAQKDLWEDARVTMAQAAS